MLYTILRPTTRIVLRGYYRKIFVNGQHNIPRGQPVILAVNHPSAFTEPCVLATHLDRVLHFLIRGDIINPRVKWFFDQTNQLPIYRFRDGFSSMRQNEKQFSYCFDLLANKGCIAIFAEGSTCHIKQTRPIQKGAARIAFGALQNRDMEEVWIVPVGVNFESSPRPRSVVAVEVGEPISTRALYNTYISDERAGLKELTDLIFQGLQKQMVDIQNNDRLQMANDLLLMASNDIPLRTLPVAEYDTSDFFDRLNAVADAINRMPAETWSQLQDLVGDYHNGLRASGLSDPRSEQSATVLAGWLLMTPLALAGWLFLGPVYLIAFSLQKKLNRKDEYVSGFRMAGFLVFVPVFILLWMVACFPFIRWWVVAFPVLLPLLSMVAVWWLDHMKSWQVQWKWNRTRETSRTNLMNQRRKIMGYLSK